MFSPFFTGRVSLAWKSLRAASDASTLMENAGEVGLVCATPASETASISIANVPRLRKKVPCEIFIRFPSEAADRLTHRRERAGPSASWLVHSLGAELGAHPVVTPARPF